MKSTLDKLWKKTLSNSMSRKSPKKAYKDKDSGSATGKLLSG